jgi:hypothetical protein
LQNALEHAFNDYEVASHSAGRALQSAKAVVSSLKETVPAIRSVPAERLLHSIARQSGIEQSRFGGLATKYAMASTARSAALRALALLADSASKAGHTDVVDAFLAQRDRDREWLQRAATTDEQAEASAQQSVDLLSRQAVRELMAAVQPGCDFATRADHRAGSADLEPAPMRP